MNKGRYSPSGNDGWTLHDVNVHGVSIVLSKALCCSGRMKTFGGYNC